ncbi:hypothetical protein N4Q66_26050, partial [Leclercia adecarboxylata]|uniref:hypothetical protein n=1 Tax=Leclercia adecarboxylata TaxID=83655 RepID=UPI00234D2BB2
PLMYCQFNDTASTTRLTCEDNFIQVLSEGDENPSFAGIQSNIDCTEVEPDNNLIYAQRAYVNRAVSYSTTETLTGGTWIDGKPIYRKCFELAGDGTTQNIVESLEGLDVENVTHISALGFRTSEYFVINGYQNGSDLTIAVSTDAGNGFDIQIVIQ